MLQLRRLFKRESSDSELSTTPIEKPDTRTPWQRYEQAKQSVTLLKGDIALLNDIPYIFEAKRSLELGELYDKLELAEQELESALRALTEERAST